MNTNMLSCVIHSLVVSRDVPMVGPEDRADHIQDYVGGQNSSPEMHALFDRMIQGLMVVQTHLGHEKFEDQWT